MNRRILALTFVSLARLAAITPVVGAQEAMARPAVAIADVAVTPGGWTLPPPQLSGAIVEMMVNELVASQRFHVYDGQWLVPETEIGGRVNLDRLRDAASSRHVDYVVLGTVTAFSTERKQKRGGGILPTPFVGGGFSRDRMQTAVGLTFKVVDVRTGEIVTTATAQGVGLRKSTGLGLLGVVRGVPLPIAAAAAASRSLNARDAMLDEAVRNAVHSAALALAQSASSLVTSPDR
jgi:curli biogenesis system outer membrane secretion channel CsgG